jgi:Flp pilus assembly protein TadG
MTRRPARRSLAQRWNAFAKRDDGTVTSEFLIMFPILIWAWIGMYYYWDVYRAVNLAQKASFTISDNLSRSYGTIDTAYIDGLQDFLAYLADTPDEDVAIRVSSIGWNKVNSTHTVQWSYSPDGSMPALTAASLQAIDDQIPTLIEHETVLLLETSIDYQPPLGIDEISGIDLGVGPQTFTEFVVTRPRFVPKVCLDGAACT